VSSSPRAPTRSAAPATSQLDGFERYLFVKTPEELVAAVRGLDPGSVRAEQVRALLARHELREGAYAATRLAALHTAIMTSAAIAQLIVSMTS
jgi:hypothetical protein